MVEMAKKRVKEKGNPANVDFRPLNMEDMVGIDTASQDVVTAQIALMFPDLRKALKEISRVLKPGGYFIGTVWVNNAHRQLLEHVISKLKNENFRFFPTGKEPEALWEVEPLDAALKEFGFNPLDGHNTEDGIHFTFGKFGEEETFDLFAFGIVEMLSKLESTIPNAKAKARQIFEDAVSELAEKNGGVVKLPNRKMDKYYAAAASPVHYPAAPGLYGSAHRYILLQKSGRGGGATTMDDVSSIVSQPGVFLVTGPSGSGKTTFVECFKPHLYMSQYHAIRPHGFVDTFYSMETLQLPYTVSNKTRIGGTIIDGLVVKGLSGGQRKIFIFAHVNVIISKSAQKLLVVVDEPFAGVTSNYVPFMTGLISNWVGNGHTVLVIDNDHHEHTMAMGWHLVKIDNRKVKLINGKNTDVAIPMTPRQRTPLPRDSARSVYLYVRHDVFNSANMSNTRVMQGLTFSLIATPFVYDPQFDVGGLAQCFAFLVILIQTVWAFVPGQITV
jgi:energy-coupling factor transporter ATP-binding protein EcfA2